jgi:hypothetical protein
MIARAQNLDQRRETLGILLNGKLSISLETATFLRARLAKSWREGRHDGHRQQVGGNEVNAEIMPDSKVDAVCSL